MTILVSLLLLASVQATLQSSSKPGQVTMNWREINGNHHGPQPIGSMCGMFTYLLLNLNVNVGKHIIHRSYR